MTGSGPWWAAAFGAGDLPVGPVPAAQRWPAAVALGARGRYAAAAAILDDLRRDRGAPLAARAHATVTLAAHRRQLGGLAPARVLDGLGLRLATRALRRDGPSVGAAAARADALTGLAADAVGLGDVPGALRLLDASREAAADAGRRPAVRVGWVAAELALLRGRPGEAVGPAREALRVSAGSPRHRLKSSIVLAVAEAAADPGRAGAALETLDAAAAQALAAGLLPLHWPAALAAADLAALLLAAPARPDGTTGVHPAGRTSPVRRDSGPFDEAPDRWWGHPNGRAAGRVVATARRHRFGGERKRASPGSFRRCAERRPGWRGTSTTRRGAHAQRSLPGLRPDRQAPDGGVAVSSCVAPGNVITPFGRSSPT